MFDITTTALSVSDWTALGLQLPKPLADKLDTLEAVRYVETEGPVTSTEKLTARNAEAKVAELAVELATAAQMQAAKSRLVQSLSREIVHAASAAVPELIEQLQPRFDASTAKFTEAVSKLPEVLTSEAIVGTGDPEVLAAFTEAQRAAADIKAIEQFLASLAQLPKYTSKPIPALRVFRPETAGQARELNSAYQAVNVSEMVRGIGNHLIAGVRLGIPFGMNTPTEVEQMVHRLEAEAQAAQGTDTVSIFPRGRRR
ncbi:hypothetical protein MPC38_02905 [Prescottella equi]|uniref:hypothetical protein n=1 Tax=Rhodococcus hoagii TaxID=43767 RepID=UPI001F5BA37B|nr:hypothetical protein [Prescottella equi]UNQ40231.1 hypothetical protein MPC38_02905 [Prescottella equi]